MKYILSENYLVKFMEQSQVNNVYKIKNKEVNYFEVLPLNASLYSDMQKNQPIELLE